MRKRNSIAKKEQLETVTPNRQDLPEGQAEPTGDNAGSTSSQLPGPFHRPSGTPRRRFRPAQRSERHSRTSHLNSLTTKPITLVERLEAMQHGIRIAELAALLGTGRTTLYDWVEAGTIPAYRHRGVIFFDPVVIAGWLRRQATMIPARAA